VPAQQQQQPLTSPPAAPTVSQPAPAAGAEGPDILQLSGQDFLDAVLDAWQVRTPTIAAECCSRYL
jgi:hypothetical protein